jgi:hypothetical protein
MGPFFYVKMGSWVLQNPTARNTQGLKSPKQSDSMILFVAVDLKQVSALGRKYPWKKPELCPCCKQSHLWGHGYSDTYFEDYPAALSMKRFLCPACGGVIKCRPKGYFSRFQTSIDAIKSHLERRIDTGHWPSPSICSRGRYWLAALKRQSLVHLGLNWLNRLVQAFDRLCRLHIVPVSMSF